MKTIHPPSALPAIPRPAKAPEILLADLPLGIEVQVARIDASDPDRIHRLAALGILPGASILLERSGSVFLAAIDRYRVAFDRAVAEAVWVRAE